MDDEAGFDEVFARADRIPGWLTRAQAEVLWDQATDLPAEAMIVEIGSHQGRSTVILASAARGQVTAIDPFIPDWRYGASDTQLRLEDNLRVAGLTTRVRLLVAGSTEVRPGWTAPIHLLYIDGKHDYWTTRDDLRWAAHVVPGGTVLIHDAFSSVGVTLALLRTLLTARRLRYRGRTGSLARLETGPVGPADRLRPLAELPWWARNLVVKVLLRLRLRRLARILGHDDVHDPY